MSVEENKAAVRRLVDEVWNKGNFAIIPELLDANFVFPSPMGIEFKGPEGYQQMITMSRTVFPDVSMTIDSMVAEGDKVAVRYTLRGTFKGDFGGIAPTGKQVEITGALFFRFANGKEVEAIEFVDSLTLFHQLGVKPPGG